MPRRSAKKKASNRDARLYRAPSLGGHWRSDGTPKTAYRSQGEAHAVADDRRFESGAGLDVYLCDFCQAWHMGNRTGREA